MRLPELYSSLGVDVADNSIVKFAVIGAVGYFAYKYFFADASTTGTTDTTGAGGGTSPGGTTGTAPTVNFNSLDAIYQRFAAAAGTSVRTPDQFNYYLAQQIPAGKTLPDPPTVFTQEGFDRNATMTIANYWGAMAPYLKANLGLSGLGFYASLYGASKGLYGYRRRA